MLGIVNGRYKILKAGADHDDYEIRGERKINKIKNTGNRIRSLTVTDLNYEIGKLYKKLEEQHCKIDDQPEKKRRDQPSATESNRFD